MYKVKIVSNFSAAHSLRGYKGKCENLHGHNWKVEVLVSSQKLNRLGMVIDFSDLKKLTKDVLEELDHKYLNDLDYFSAKGEISPRSPLGGAEASGGKEPNPSSEEIARYIFNKLKPQVSGEGCNLEEIRVWETEGSCAIYRE